MKLLVIMPSENLDAWMEEIIVAFIRRPQLLRTTESKQTKQRSDCNALFTQDMFIIVAAFFYLRDLPQLLQISSLFLWLWRLFCCIVVLWSMWPETSAMSMNSRFIRSEMSGFNDSNECVSSQQYKTLYSLVVLAHINFIHMCVLASSICLLMFRYIYIRVTFVANSAYRYWITWTSNECSRMMNWCFLFSSLVPLCFPFLLPTNPFARNVLNI